MLDAPNPYYSLTTDGGHFRRFTITNTINKSPEGPQSKILSTRVPNCFFRFRCDQDSSVVKPLFEFDPYDKSYDNIISPPEENGEQTTGKGNRVLTTNFTLEIQN